MPKKKCLWCGAENENAAWECQKCGETEFSAWGGKREGAGSGGARSGAGRPRKTWNSGGKGEIWFVEFSKPGGFPNKPQQWRVLGVDEDGTIEFQNIETEEIISFIHPNNYT